jgi:hypothetical protein
LPFEVCFIIFSQTFFTVDFDFINVGFSAKNALFLQIEAADDAVSVVGVSALEPHRAARLKANAALFPYALVVFHPLNHHLFH